jgi:hypothetical protein
MIDEAKENPNFLAEKQAELKKAGKKGKKWTKIEIYEYFIILVFRTAFSYFLLSESK